MRNPLNVLRAGLACVVLSIPLIALTVYGMTRVTDRLANGLLEDPSSAAVGVSEVLPYGMIGFPLLVAGVIFLIIGFIWNRRLVVHPLGE